MFNDRPAVLRRIGGAAGDGVRRLEMAESSKIVRQALETIPEGEIRARVPRNITVALIDSRDVIAPEIDR